MTREDLDLIIILCLILIPLLLLLSAAIIRRYYHFSRELRYLNKEIRRTCGSERKVWLRRRRKLWLSLLPFVRY